MFVVDFISASPLSPLLLSHCYTNKQLGKKEGVICVAVEPGINSQAACGFNWTQM